MKADISPRTRWCTVVIYALAMAWVEAAVVLYLRTLTHRLDPYQPGPLEGPEGLAGAELVRELATLIMLGAVGWLAGRSWRVRFGYVLVAFGVWDIFYYVFLKVLTGWPRSLVDWDVLFLLPLPWWGPVLAPALIALLMVLAGTLITQGRDDSRPPWPRWPGFVACAAGIALALYVFMVDALLVAAQGATALRQMLPTQFNWPLFVVALALLAAPILDLLRQVPLLPPDPNAATEVS
jgi:hypothetical protein